MMKNLALPLITIVALTGCSGSFQTAKDLDSSAQPTSTVITPENPYVTTVPGAGSGEQTNGSQGSQTQGNQNTSEAQLVMGFLSMEHARISFSNSRRSLRVTGNLIKKAQDGHVEWQSEIELTGTVDSEGFASVMNPGENSSADLRANLRGRGMCIENNGHPCAQAVVEVIYRESDTRAHSLQLETNEPMVGQQVATPPTIPPSSSPQTSQPAAQPPAASTAARPQTPAAAAPGNSPTTTVTLPSANQPSSQPRVTAPGSQATSNQNSNSPSNSQRTSVTTTTTTLPAGQNSGSSNMSTPSSTDEEDAEGDGGDEAEPDLYIGQRYEDWRALYGDQKPEAAASSNGNQSSGTPRATNTRTSTTTTTTTMPANSQSSQGSQNREQTNDSARPQVPSASTSADSANRPRDQVIGLPYTVHQRDRNGRNVNIYGRLENGTYMITENNRSPQDQRVRLYLPEDDHLYGSWELVQLIRAAGRYALTMNVPFYVGDLAKRGGGYNPPHASHQNGLDVDIGFPFEHPERYGGTPTAVDRQGHVASGFKVRETYDIFKYFLSSGALNRIFVHQGVKTALCNEAVRRGELNSDRRTGSALELMSRIRPEAGHIRHFHVRIRCSIYQRRCRTLQEPVRATGC